MHHRLLALLAIVCFAFAGAGCESLFQPSKPKSSKKKKTPRERKQYEEVIMPLQTGSTLQRRMFVEKRSEDEPEPKKKPKKKESPKPKPEAEPTAAETPPPTPTQEATPEPTPERFR